jgi:hypothetical protein
VAERRSLLEPGLAQLTDPDPPTTSSLRSAAHTYQRTIDQFIQDTGFAA